MDTKAVLAGVNLIQLVERSLGPAGRVSGKYHFWACPFHDDSNPSFAVTGDRYHCFGCGASGDAIEWLQKFEGLSFQNAIQRLGNPFSTFQRIEKSPEQNKGLQIIAKAKQKALPDLQNAWKEIIRTCEANLWGDKGKQARQYLNDRGLKDDTLRSPFVRLGYSEGQKIADIWVDRGIVIPCFTVDKKAEVDRIAYIKIRRGKAWVYKPEDKAKYRKLYGASGGLYGASLVYGSDLVFVTEGELDALLLWQEAGSLAGVCTLGSASERVDLGKWGRYLSYARRLFIAYDNDPAGQKGLDYWQSWNGRAVKAGVPAGKDITEAYLSGVDLSDWVIDTIKTVEKI